MRYVLAALMVTVGTWALAQEGDDPFAGEPPKETRAAIDRARAQLAKLNQAEKLYLAAKLDGRITGLPDMAVGSVGAVIELKFEVRQVIDERSALVDLKQWIDVTNSLAGLGLGDFMLRGIDTSAYSDGRSYSLKNRFVGVPGTVSYTTVLGAKRTVKALDVVDEAKLTWLVEISTKMKRYRKWPVIGEAFFLKMDGTTVLLQDLDERAVTLKLSELTDADRKWIRDFNAAEKKRTDAAKRQRSAKAKR